MDKELVVAFKRYVTPEAWNCILQALDVRVASVQKLLEIAPVVDVPKLQGQLFELRQVAKFKTNVEETLAKQRKD